MTILVNMRVLYLSLGITETEVIQINLREVRRKSTSRKDITFIELAGRLKSHLKSQKDAFFSDLMHSNYARVNQLSLK